MKKVLFTFICVALTACLWAQVIQPVPVVESADKPIAKIKKFENKEKTMFTTLTLANGMEVVLCEDHSQPKIWGAVCVHAGGKNDPANNTGMAHYLEHLMFKGTDQIGTLNWPEERELLDQIVGLYDKLHGTTDENTRNKLLDEINVLSNKAADFAIPNEVDVVLSKMGGEGVNAFTSNDVTVYLNSFPSNQLEKWLMVYAERFRHPVFRLFQSELEAVYEEYNMYQDQPISVFMEDAVAEAYGKHPYGRPVIGYQQHLKNPQISAMQKFFNTYYHPNNMTLVLVGDFNSQEIEGLLNQTIGNYHNECENVDPAMVKNTERMNTDLAQDVKPFKGHQIVTVKETPVKMGIIGFQTIGANNLNEFYLDILSSFLNNDDETGLLDKLVKEKKVLAANAFNYTMLEHGMFAFFYVPKIVGQSHENAESYIFAAIDSLKTGHFSDQLFDAVKMSCLKEHLLSMETLDDKFYMVLTAVGNKQHPKIIYERERMIRNLTKEEIVKLANQYFNDDCLIYRSNMGSKEQVKLQKPMWKPIVTQNSEKASMFAESLETIPVKTITPQVINFKSDVKELPINENFVLYSSSNPYNDFFTLTITYDYGNLNDRLFATAVKYVAGQGTRDNDFDHFQVQLQELGGSMELYSTDDQLHISISGFEKEFPKIMRLCHEKLFNPGNDKKVLQAIIEDKEGDAKMVKDDASTWGRALYYYALYGQNSPYLTQLTIKELKKLSGDELIKSFSKALMFGGHATFVGNLEVDKVGDIVKGAFVGDKSEESKRAVRQLVKYEQPTIFISSNSKFLQSNIYFYKLGETLENLKDRVDCRLYNEYMGGSMASVIFQEIRELRSLGYSAYASYQYDKLNRRPGYLMGYLGTQSDKTLEGCQAMGDLLTSFPKRSEKFEMARTSCLRAMEANYVSARDIPKQVQSWKEQRYESDPREAQLKLIAEEDMDQIMDFCKQKMGKSPLIITIAGDKSRIDLKELSKTYKIVELKYSDFIKE